MQIFEKQMRKVIDKKTGKLKEYNISLGVNSEINEERFYIKPKDSKAKNDVIVCDVIIGFPDEYENLMKEHDSLQSLNNELNESIKILQDKLSNIEESHQKEIKKKDDEYSARIDELNDIIHNKDLEIERTKTNYETDIGNLKERHQKEINALKLFDEDYHLKISDHQNEMSELKERHQKEFSGIKDQIARETIHHNDNLNSLEKSLSLFGFIKGDYKSPLKDLKEDIEQFRYIAQYIESKENAILQDVNLKEDDE